MFSMIQKIVIIQTIDKEFWLFRQKINGLLVGCNKSGALIFVRQQELGIVQLDTVDRGSHRYVLVI